MAVNANERRAIRLITAFSIVGRSQVHIDELAAEAGVTVAQARPVLDGLVTKNLAVSLTPDYYGVTFAGVMEFLT